LHRVAASPSRSLARLRRAFAILPRRFGDDGLSDEEGRRVVSNKGAVVAKYAQLRTGLVIV
jgi:hypothetical protein